MTYLKKAVRSTEGVTQAACQAESDGINEETNIGQLSKPMNDNLGDNKLPTSLDDE